MPSFAVVLPGVEAKVGNSSSQSKPDPDSICSKVISDKVSKDTEDTAHSCILSVSKIHFQSTFINGVSVSKYLKDTEDTAFRVSVSVC